VPGATFGGSVTARKLRHREAAHLRIEREIDPAALRLAAATAACPAPADSQFAILPISGVNCVTGCGRALH